MTDELLGLKARIDHLGELQKHQEELFNITINSLKSEAHRLTRKLQEVCPHSETEEVDEFDPHHIGWDRMVVCSFCGKTIRNL